MSELKKINGPLNIVGELEATSLDVNGAADISGAVVIGSTLDVAGHIQLTDGAQRNIIGALNQNLGIYANPNGANEGIKFSTDEGSTIEMIILNGGNVGVGTATPGYKLDVSGNVNISGTGGYLRFNSGDVAVKNEGSYKLGFQTYNSTSSSLTTKMVLDTNGNVGIGTVTPGSKLQIYSAATRDIFISGHGTQAQNDWQAEHAFFSSAGQGVMVGKANANNNTNRLHILYNNSSGDAQYLGYNTSNVLKVKLDTNGDSFLNGGGLTVGGKITGTELEGTSLDINGNADIAGNLVIDAGVITIDPDTAGSVFTWKESDSATVAGQLRSYANRGDIYLYSDGVKKTELSSQSDSFIPKLHIGGTSGAGSGYVLQTTGGVDINGTLTVGGSVQHHVSQYTAPDNQVSFDRTSSSDQWFRIITSTSAPKRIKLSVSSNGDNTNTLDQYLISQSGYSMQSHIHRLPGSKYNTSKLISVMSLNPTGSTQEVWIKLLGMSSGTGTTVISANVPISSSSVILGTATTTKPTLTTGDTELEISVADRNTFTTMSSRGGKFGSDVTSTKLNVNQAADDQGLQINGYDDRSGSTATLRINSAGHTTLSQTTDSGSGYLFLSAENYLNLSAGTLIYIQQQLRIYDAGSIAFGNGGDFVANYNNTADEFRLMEGTSGSKGLKMDTDGKVTFTEAATFAGQLNIARSGNAYNTSLVITDNARKIVFGRDQLDIKDLSDNAAMFYIQANTGGTSFGGEVYVPSKIIHRDDTNTFIGFDDGNDTFRVVTGGSERLGITNSRTVISNGNLDVDGGDFYVALAGTMQHGNYSKRQFASAGFANNTANLGVILQFPNNPMQGYLKITLSNSYSNQNATGELTKIIPFGWNQNNAIWGAGADYAVNATGPIANNFTIGDIAWNGTTSTYDIPIYHIVSTGNALKIIVEYFGGGAQVLEDVTLTSPASITIPAVYATKHNTRVHGAFEITGDGSNATVMSESGSGNFEINTVGDITLDAGGGDIILSDDGTNFGDLEYSGGSFNIVSKIADTDIRFYGNDNGSSVTALRLNMAEGGNATFSGDINIGANYIGRDSTDMIDFSSDNQMAFRANNASRVTIDAAQMYPNANNSYNLGHGSYRWNNLYFGDGSIIDFNGDVTIQHSNNLLTIAGGGLATADIYPTKIHLGNVDLYPSGDNNHLHFTGTAMIGASTTASSNPKIGTSTYPFHQMHADSFHGTTVTASGEVEGGSLDINGNADITGNLAVNSGGIGLTQGYGVNFGVSGYDIVMPSTTTIVMKTGAENAILATVNAGVKLYFNNVVKLETVTGGANVTGTLTATADVIAYSDERLKENVQTLDGKKVLEMRGVSFDRLDDGKSSSGVIAQELEKVAPELVVDDGDYKGVAYGNLVGYLIEAVKDQQKQIDELKAMINGNS